MEKVYDIKIKDLENILSLLKENMVDVVVVKDAIRLEEYIKRIKNSHQNIDSFSLLEKIQDDIEYHDFYKPFYPIVERFVLTGRSVDELNSGVKYKSILFGEKQIMQDVIDFYKLQGKLFYSLLLEFYNEAEDHLKFISDNLNTEGETLFLKSIGEAFVFSPNYSNITKFTILIHEIQHVIDFYINPNFSEEYIIRETIAMFMEMIAADYISRKYRLFDEGLKRQIYLHTIIKYQSHNILNKIYALDIASDNRLLNQEELVYLLNKEGFDQEELEFYFEQSITNDMAYQIAYLIAIELYMIYYRDQDLAFKICEDIIINGNSNNIFILLDKYGIKLNSNVVKYENKIFKKRLIID